MPDEPLDHILRSQPPWDDTQMTECGRDDVKGEIITRDEYTRRFKARGQQRTAMTTCMTCLTTANRYRPWEVDPVGCLIRWMDQYGRYNAENPREKDARAMGALIMAHRDEYDAFIAGLDQTEDLAARRRHNATLARLDPHTRRI